MRTPGGIPSPVRGSQTTFFKSMIVCPGPKDRGRLLEAIMSAALLGVQGVSTRTRQIVTTQYSHTGMSRCRMNPWYCTVSPFLARPHPRYRQRGDQQDCQLPLHLMINVSLDPDKAI